MRRCTFEHNVQPARYGDAVLDRHEELDMR
jgi:hypothetical protein